MQSGAKYYFCILQRIIEKVDELRYFLILLLCMNLVGPVYSNNIDTLNTQLTAKRALIVNGETGDVLYSKDAFLPWHPASTTKLMTALLVLENNRLNDITTVSASAMFLEGDYKSRTLRVGTKLTIEQLLNMSLIESDNAACNTLAEYVDGTQKRFVEHMNRRAKELGLTAHFVTAYGMTNQEHYLSAFDLYRIAQENMKYPIFRMIVSKPFYRLHNEDLDYTLKNRNQFIGVDSRVKGIKTGYTDAAQCNLVCYAEDDNHSIYTVVMGSPRKDIDYSYPDSKLLLDYGFKILKERNNDEV